MNTKEIIKRAAFELLREFPLDTITVQMILNRAEVSRKTFYRHYPDKYALMELYYRDFMDQNIKENYNGHNWEEVIGHLYDFVVAEKSYFRNVNKYDGTDSFWNFLHDYSYDFYSAVKLRNTGADRLTEEERLTVIMLVEGQMAVLKLLVEDQVSLDRADFSRIICSLTPASYQEMRMPEELTDGQEKTSFTRSSSCSRFVVGLSQDS